LRFKMDMFYWFAIVGISFISVMSVVPILVMMCK
jgi:hypothetical protein